MASFLHSAPHGYDPEGNPRTIPVQAKPGLIVWHSRQEWDRFMAGVDVEAARLLEAKA